MSPRRGFLALVGGALLSGAVQRRASAETPTLVLPPSLTLTTAGWPLLEAAQAAGKCQMDVILECGIRMPREAHLDWLEDGLRRSLLYAEPDHAATNRRIAAAVAKHGGLIEARRAGAL